MFGLLSQLETQEPEPLWTMGVPVAWVKTKGQRSNLAFQILEDTNRAAELRPGTQPAVADSAQPQICPSLRAEAFRMPDQHRHPSPNHSRNKKGFPHFRRLEQMAAGRPGLET